MERSEVLTRPLREVLRQADHDDLQPRLDPGGGRRPGSWTRKTVPPLDFKLAEAAVERMRAAWTNDTLLDEGGDALSELRAGVGDKEPNGRVDVAKVEALLEAAGACDLKRLKGPTGHFATGKSDAIRDFQRAKGLEADGRVLPNGPTIKALKAAVPVQIRSSQEADDEAGSSGDQVPRYRSPRQLAQRNRSRDEREVEAGMNELTRPMREGLLGFPQASPEQHAFSKRIAKWPRKPAWREIEEAKANPNATLRPKYWETRIWAILNGRKAVFDISDNPTETGLPPLHRDHAKGVTIVSRYGAIIEREARNQGVDPNLVRAIVYVENADGNFLGINKAIENAGFASSLLPMNIQNKTWAGIGGVKSNEFKNPERNIHAGVTLIKAITDRLRPEDRTPAKIGSIWNATAAEFVNEIGARIQRTFDEKTWKK
jgi:peptidoglycan hydrolase-like protein with peptidoglycan-binding domain